MIDFVSMVKKCNTSLFSIDIERLDSYENIFVTKSRHSCPENRLTLKVNNQINHYLHKKYSYYQLRTKYFNKRLPEKLKFSDFRFFLSKRLQNEQITISHEST